MSAKPPNLIPRREHGRDSARRPVMIPATCQVGDRDAEEVLLTDISTDGRRVELVSIGVTRAAPIVLCIGGEAPVTGRLAWIRQGSLGVTFDAPLDEPTVARLGELTPDTNVVPLRRSDRT